MKKDRVRDYATAAFRDYALYKSDKLDKCADQPFLNDLCAVEKTLDFFNTHDKQYIVEAVQAVYFSADKNPIRKRSISERVRRFAVDCSADESTVYRWLKEARNKFAHFRGLTL